MAPVVVYSPADITGSMTLYRAMLCCLYVCSLHAQGAQPLVLVLEVQC